MKKKNYKEILPYIKAFIFDVDGVLTNGKVLITSGGEMLREMDVKDGYAMKCAFEQGFKIAVISGGTNKGVKTRLKALGVQNIYLGAHEKQSSFIDFLKKENLNPNEILYMGDDVPDIEIMDQVAIATCPNDAASDVIKISDYISHRKGGEGCVRDILEQVLRVQNKWYKNPNLKKN